MQKKLKFFPAMYFYQFGLTNNAIEKHWSASLVNVFELYCLKNSTNVFWSVSKLIKKSLAVSNERSGISNKKNFFLCNISNKQLQKNENTICLFSLVIFNKPLNIPLINCQIAWKFLVSKFWENKLISEIYS